MYMYIYSTTHYLWGRRYQRERGQEDVRRDSRGE